MRRLIASWGKRGLLDTLFPYDIGEISGALRIKTKEAMIMKRQQYLGAVRTHITITSLAALLFAGVAVADGTHNTKVTVKNEANREIEVQTFNHGIVHIGHVPHKVYYIGKNGERNVKAHGGGVKKIKLLILSTGSGNRCTDTVGNLWFFRGAKNKKTVTIDHCRKE